MKHVVLAWWKKDADEAAIKEFVDAAPRILARGPFLSCDHGVNLKPRGTSPDWAFIGELPDGDADLWGPADAHRELHAKILPILDRACEIDI